MDGERCGVETVLEDEKRHSCYLKVFFYEGARAGTARKERKPRPSLFTRPRSGLIEKYLEKLEPGRELNPRPTDYELIQTTYSGYPRRSRQNKPQRSRLAACRPRSSWCGAFW